MYSYSVGLPLHDHVPNNSTVAVKISMPRPVEQVSVSDYMVQQSAQGVKLFNCTT